MPSLAEVRARVETDLPDETLQKIIDAELEALIDHAGSDSATEMQFASGLRAIVLNRKPKAITAVRERRLIVSPQIDLATDDWRQQGNYALLRLSDGTHPATCWGSEVVIEYQPHIDYALRERVLLDLVQMSVEFRGIESERIGDYQRSETQSGYQNRRQALLNQVREGRGLIS